MPEDGVALDDQAWSSLSGTDARFAIRSGDALRYDPAISPFAAVCGPFLGDALRDLARLASAVVHPSPSRHVPSGSLYA